MQPNILKIKQTAYPCGFVLKYIGGMAQPEVKNLGEIMKVAAFNHIQETREPKGFIRFQIA